MPTGIHGGKRGRKPLPPEVKARRRIAATRRAAKKWYHAHKRELSIHDAEVRFRHRNESRRHQVESISDTLSAIRELDLREPEYHLLGKASPNGWSFYERWEDPEAMADRILDEILEKAFEAQQARAATPAHENDKSPAVQLKEGKPLKRRSLKNKGTQI
jgi:hypothetical protein